MTPSNIFSSRGEFNVLFQSLASLQKRFEQLPLFLRVHGASHFLRRSVYACAALAARCARATVWLLAPHLVMKVFTRHILALLLLMFIPRFLRCFFASLRKYFPLLRVRESAPLKEQRARMTRAETYTEWAKSAAELDRLEGKHVWKNSAVSRDYDYRRILEDTQHLRKLRDSGKVRGLMHYLRSRLLRNLGGIGNSSLYQQLRVGTKTVIERYLEEVCDCLELILRLDAPGISSSDKLAFFTETRHSFGRSALMFSGGGTLGLYHAGVVSALIEEGLLPRIISGSSVGSIFAALICSRSDEELRKLKTGDTINFNFFPSQSGSALRKLKRLWKNGVLMDINILKKCIRSNIGDVTFQEAYETTGRILNITVSYYESGATLPRLLNYLTAPNVIIWSAVCASCAIPFVFNPVELIVKTRKGTFKPYYLKGVKFSDGTFSHDLPTESVAELFNVNHFVVSQVNAHVVPFVEPFGAPWTGRWFDRLFLYLGKQCLHTLQACFHLGIIQGFSIIRNVVFQKWQGDITFNARINPSDYPYLLSNPSKEGFVRFLDQSQRRAWPMLSRVRSRCAIEFTLDACVREMRAYIIRESMDAEGEEEFTGEEMAGMSVKRRQNRKVSTMGTRVSSWTPEAFHGYLGKDSVPQPSVGTQQSHSSIFKRINEQKSEDKSQSKGQLALPTDPSLEPVPSPRKMTGSERRFLEKRKSRLASARGKGLPKSPSVPRLHSHDDTEHARRGLPSSVSYTELAFDFDAAP
eukprot:396197_1